MRRKTLAPLVLGLLLLVDPSRMALAQAPPVIDPTLRSGEPPPLFRQEPGPAPGPVLPPIVPPPIVEPRAPAPTGRVLVTKIRVVGNTVFSPEELAPWFEAVEERLSISPWLVTPNANNDVLFRGARKLGIGVSTIARNVRHCWNLGYCGLGCPTNAKQSMLVTTIPAALDRGATLVTRARGERRARLRHENRTPGQPIERRGLASIAPVEMPRQDQISAAILQRLQRQSGAPHRVEIFSAGARHERVMRNQNFKNLRGGRVEPVAQPRYLIQRNPASFPRERSSRVEADQE